MQFKSGKSYSKKFFLNFVFVFLYPVLSFSAVSVEPASPYQIISDTIYYSTNSISGVMDTGYHAFDITVDQDSDTEEDEMLLIDIASDQSFTLESGEDLVVTVYATMQSSSTPQAVSIGAAGYTTGTPTHCKDSNSLCSQNDYYSDYYFAAKYQEGSTLRIGLYPKEICLTAYNLSGGISANGCNGADVDTTTSSAQTLILKVVIGPNRSDGLASSDESENKEFNIRLQGQSPETDCASSDTTNFYFPGDSQILVYPDLISTNVGVTNGAPITHLMVIGKNGGTPNTTDPLGDGVNDVIGRAEYGIAESAIDGFVNTTDGSDNIYTIIVAALDASGAITDMGSACTITPVYSSEIVGFLEESECFIATGAFRSGTAWPVMILREFRDQILLESKIGQSFVGWYYGWSPGAARWLIKNEVFRYPIIVALLPLVFLAWFLLHPILGGLLALSFLIPVGLLIRKRIHHIVGFIGLALLGSSTIRAEEIKVEQPYIDEIKQVLAEEDKENQKSPSATSYTEEIKSKLQSESNNEKSSYTEEIKKQLDPKEEGPSYSESLKPEIKKRGEERGQTNPATGANQSSIQAVLDGKSELKPYYEGRIRHAAGLRVGASVDRFVTASVPGTQTFEGVYGGGYAPDFTAFYEYQPIHSESLGSLGLYGSFGLSYFTGVGTFKISGLTDPGGNAFGSQSKTDFSFFLIPVSLGLSYRFNLLHYIRPYVIAGPNLTAYLEARSDGLNAKRGVSRSVFFTGGVSILLDWIDSGGAWNLYDEHGVRHVYLNVEYSKIFSFAGLVEFDISGVYAGFTVEF